MNIDHQNPQKNISTPNIAMHEKDHNTVMKWDLFQECKAGTAFTYQYM